MANYGIKIAKEEKEIVSTDIDDYVFWSKHPSLTLLEKKTVELTATSASCGSKTEVVSHTYGFFPLVLGTVKKTGGIPTGDHDNRYFMPAENFSGINCDSGLAEVLTFNYRVKPTTVEIIWETNCVLMGSEECPLSNQTFTVELYFFMWKLGSKWPA